MENYKIEIDKDSICFQEFLLNIKDFFKQNSNIIHKARNELKVIEYKDTQTVVKAFRVPNFINQIVYAYFRDSKAKKSYKNAIKLKNLNINTPKPIGYIEFYKFGLLDESYFVSEKFDYDFTIREPLLDINFPNKDNILKAFAKFTFDLHEAGIFHLDYSPGNILIKKENDNFIFKIVDINRMKFLNMDLEKRAKNFSKLWAKDEDLEFIAKEYAKIYEKNNEEFISKTISFSKKHKAVKNFKKRLKGIKVVD